MMQTVALDFRVNVGEMMDVKESVARRKNTCYILFEVEKCPYSTALWEKKTSGYLCEKLDHGHFFSFFFLHWRLFHSLGKQLTRKYWYIPFCHVSMCHLSTREKWNVKLKAAVCLFTVASLTVFVPLHYCLVSLFSPWIHHLLAVFPLLSPSLFPLIVLLWEFQNQLDLK